MSEEVFEPKPLPLPTALFKKAVKKKIKLITLIFSGGNDEGMLTVNTEPEEPKFADEVEKWAFEVFDYNFLVSGYGNGLDYEDRLVYDIEKKTVSTWGFTIQKVKRKQQYTEKETTTKQIEIV